MIPRLCPLQLLRRRCSITTTFSDGTQSKTRRQEVDRQLFDDERGLVVVHHTNRYQKGPMTPALRSCDVSTFDITGKAERVYFGQTTSRTPARTLLSIRCHI